MPLQRKDIDDEEKVVETFKAQFRKRFVGEFDFARSHLDAFNTFITTGIPAILEDMPEMVNYSKDTDEIYVTKWYNPEVSRPCFRNPETGLMELLLPYQARQRNMSYMGTLATTVSITVHRWKPPPQPTARKRQKKNNNRGDVNDQERTAAQADNDNDNDNYEDNDNEDDNKLFTAAAAADAAAEMGDWIDDFRAKYGEIVRYQTKLRQPLTEIPVMLWSSLCNLNYVGAGFCPGSNDMPGKFIINGTDRIISPLSRLCWNHDFVFRKKKFAAEVEVRSCHDTKTHRSTATLKCQYTLPNAKLPMNGRQTLVSIPFLAKKIPVAIVFLALGWPLHTIPLAIRTGGAGDWHSEYDGMIQHLLVSCKIKTEDDALYYIAQCSKKSKQSSMYSSNAVGGATAGVGGTSAAGAGSSSGNSNSNGNNNNSGGDLAADVLQQRQEQIEYARQTILNREVLPQVGLTTDSNLEKGLYLGNMVKLLFMMATNRLVSDNRDEAGWKRHDTAGVLMTNLLRQTLGPYSRLIRQLMSKFLEKEAIAKHSRSNTSKYTASANATTDNDSVSKKRRKVTVSSKKKKTAVPGEIPIASLFTSQQITMRFITSFGTGAWGASKTSVMRVGVVRTATNVNPIAATSEIARLSSALKPDGKHLGARSTNITQYGRVCITETPEGRQTGLARFTALGARLTIGSNPRWIIALIEAHAEELHFVPIKKWGQVLCETKRIDCFDSWVRLRVEGIPIGWITQDPEQFEDWIAHLRRTSSYDGEISSYYERPKNQIIVRVDPGRLVRPLHLIQKLKERAHWANTHCGADYSTQKDAKEERISNRDASSRAAASSLPKRHHWSLLGSHNLVTDECVEYLDGLETKRFSIAFNWRDYVKRTLLAETANNKGKQVYIRPITHCEIDGSFQFSLGTSLIPFPQTNQSPRNIYQCAMGKQAMGQDPNTSPVYRSRQELYFPQHPLSSTETGKMDNYMYQTSGCSVYMALFSDPFNQEDSLKMRAAFVERGGLQSANIKVFKDSQRRFGSLANREAFECPDFATCGGIKEADYSKINRATGVPLLNTRIAASDIVIAKTAPVRALTSQKEARQTKEAKDFMDKLHGVIRPPPPIQITRRCASTAYKGEPGYVSDVLDTCNATGHGIRKVQITVPRTPVAGDKFATRHGQKGTIGCICNDEDMIYAANGFIPDVVLNPNCLISRMTIAQEHESLFGLLAAISGEEVDATAFQELNLEQLKAKLLHYGFAPNGKQVMYHPETGNEIETEIYVGVPWYQRLRHLVGDKLHARGPSGPKETITLQPLEGRNRDGGQRFGEMENSTMQSHGAAQGLRERLLTVADKEPAYICRQCGFVGFKHKETGAPWCTPCKTGQHIYRTDVAYAFVFLLAKELQAMGIRIKFNIEPIDRFFSPALILKAEFDEKQRQKTKRQKTA